MTDPKIWFSSDHHFHHENIIRYCNRPYRSCLDMNDDFVTRWNNKVRPDDIVFYLGDFTLKPGFDVEQILDELNGHKVLIFGNHDRRSVKEMPQWVNVFKYYSECFECNGTDYQIHMRHVPFKPNETRCGQYEIYLHGHMHNINGNFFEGQIDVGVDGWEYAPVSLEEIVDLHERMWWK